MTIDRLPESTATLYAELLDQALIFECSPGIAPTTWRKLEARWIDIPRRAVSLSGS